MSGILALCGELFLRFLKIGACSFGGGYASLALIREEAVQATGWLTEADFTGLCAIAEMTPGPVTLNAASFTGWQTAGLAGAAAATLGCILPSICIIALLSRIYLRYGNHPLLRSILIGMRPVICAMVVSAAVSMFL